MLNTRIIVKEYGGPDSLMIVEEPLRKPQKNEVRVRVLSAGVALADVMRREGKYPGTPQAPFTPGYDAVGIVDELGEDVRHIRKGQRVAVFYEGIGGYASYVYAGADEVYPVPEEIDSPLAAAVILNYVTAYQMLFRFAKVTGGERILIHGAGGGTGTALLDLGRYAGVKMFGTASAAKHSIIIGYEGRPIDYRTEDFVKVIREQVPQGMDAVFDPIGGSNWDRSFETLGTNGRFIGYGYTSVLGHSDSDQWKKDWAGLSASQAGSKSHPAYLYSVTGLRKEHPEWFREDLAHVYGLLAEGKIKPLIGARFPLTEAGQAHRLLESSQASGKIVLDCS